jgi:arginyl-tRNA synthetase
MSLSVSKAKEQINNSIIDSAKKAMAAGLIEECELTAFNVEVPANREHGDYAVNAAMVWARLFHKAPRLKANP